MIFPKVRDPRFITIRRGGTLTDSDHHLLALWAAICAEHVLPLFESANPLDLRPRQAITQVRVWTRGEIAMSQSRSAGGHAMGAAGDLHGAARFAAYSAGQAAVVAHVAAHELGAAAKPSSQQPLMAKKKIDDQRLRNAICWSVFTY
jgi:hypothetical protein